MLAISTVVEVLGVLFITYALETTQLIKVDAETSLFCG